MHKSGFVNIIGKPNVGKSTLMNALVGERMSIITAKPQTTRHRIIGILSGDDFQIVFSDTPGLVKDPSYRMHLMMNRFVHSTFEDADVLCLVTEPTEIPEPDNPLLEKIRNVTTPRFLVMNKMDQHDEHTVRQQMDAWSALAPFEERFAISALQQTHTQDLLNKILEYLPEGPAYYPKDQLTDRPERFFVSEIIREHVLNLYEQEIPYSTEVTIESFKETTTVKGEPLIKIAATLYVARKSQKNILIGKEGRAIKTLGTHARQALETFLESKIFLELHVKVKENWRDDDRSLQSFGYQN